MPTKIIIVDDHELYRNGIHTFLSKTPTIEIIGEASCAKELYTLLDNGLQPDILLLDIILPGQKGTDIARIIKHAYPNIKIVILSSETSEELIVELSEIGINGFISKSSRREELIQAIESVAEDIPYFGKDIAKTMYDIYICKKGESFHKTNNDNQDLLFTKKELEIIRLCGDGLHTKEIAETLCISARTVETHRRNIFTKLGISNSVELLKYGIKNGIIQL